MRAQRQTLTNRRGALMVIVLICLILILMMTGIVVRVLLAHRDQARADQRRLQAEWLAESGLERAQAKLASSSSYQGETWEIPAEALASSWRGRVTITVAEIDGHPNDRLIRAQAEFPRDTTLRVRHSKQLTVTLNTESSGDQP